MNKLFRLSALFLLITSCCRRYEDGPGISFRSKLERMCNDWKVEVFYRGHADRTIWFNDTYPGYREVYQKDGTYRSASSNGGAEGSWDFFDYKDEVRVVTPGSTRELVLLKLTEKELWYSRKEGGEELEYHLVPN